MKRLLVITLLCVIATVRTACAEDGVKISAIPPLPNIQKMAVSSDGSRAVLQTLGTGGPILQLWDVAGNQYVGDLPRAEIGLADISGMVFSRDGRYLYLMGPVGTYGGLTFNYSTSPHSLIELDLDTMKRTRSFPIPAHDGFNDVEHLALAKSGDKVLFNYSAVSSSQAIQSLDLKSGRISAFKKYDGILEAISEDGTYYLLQTFGMDNHYKVYRMKDNRPAHRFRTKEILLQPILSHDGTLVTSNTPKAKSVIEAGSGRELLSLPEDVNVLGIDTAGRVLTQAIPNFTSRGSLMAHDLRDGSTIPWLSSVKTAGIGNSVVQGNHIIYFDPVTDKETHRSVMPAGTPHGAIVFASHHGKYVKVDDRKSHTVWLYDGKNGKLIRSYKGVDSLSVSPDERYLLTINHREYDRDTRGFSGFPELNVYSAPDGKKVWSWKGKQGGALIVGHFMSNASNLLSLGGDDVDTMLVDLSTGHEVARLPARGTNKADWYGNYLLFEFERKESIEVWSVKDQRKVWEHTIPDGQYLFGTLGPEGKRVLLYDGHSQLEMWDIARNRRMWTSKMSGWTHFNVSGKYLITQDPQTNTVTLRNPVDGRVIVRKYRFADGELITMTPEGFFSLSSPKAAKYLRVTIGSKVYSIDQFYDRFYRPDLVAAAMGGKGQEAIRMAAAKTDLGKVAASGAPPVVSFVSPSAGLSSQRDVEVVASLAEQDGGIGKVEWKLNGMTVGVMEPGRGIAIKGKPGAAPAGAIQLKRTLTLAPGENSVEIVAYSKMGIASNPVALHLNLKDAISEKPALYILAIGINKYRDKSLWLNYAVPDAQALTGSMKNAGSSIFTGVHVTGVYDQDATFDGIHSAFEQVAKSAKSNDVFILYLAGHGITLDGRYHFLPADFRYYNEDSIRKASIDQDHLQRWMAEIPAMKNLVLLDTCNSGSFVEAQAVTRGLAEKTAIDKLVRATGRAVISASTDSQVALEGFKGHGIFTYALLQAMKQADAKDGNKDGVTSTGEIANFVQEYVPDVTYRKWGYEQVPQVNLHGRSFPVAVVAK